MGETETTQELCRRQNIKFVPMVTEAHGGGWSKSARQIIDCVAKHSSASWNANEGTASLQIAQRLSTTLHRENARAILKRLQEQVVEDAPLDGYAEPDESLW